MEPARTRKLYVSLALQGLQEAAEHVQALEVQLAQAKALRDELLADAVQERIPITRLSRITKLSRQAIYRIVPGRIEDD